LFIQHDDRREPLPQRVRFVMPVPLFCSERIVIVQRDGRAWKKVRPLLYRTELVEVSIEKNDGDPSEILLGAAEPAKLLVHRMQRPRSEHADLVDD
jgi:hypothetical protein